MFRERRHNLCRLIAAFAVLMAINLPTYGGACCDGGGAGVARSSTQVSGKSARAGNGSRDCCQAVGSTAPGCSQQAQPPCTDSDSDAGSSTPRDRETCAAVCCHVNAVAPRPVSLLLPATEPMPQVALADQAAPGRTDADAVFHPPRGELSAAS